MTQIDPRRLLITSGLRLPARRTPGKTALRFEDRIVTYGALAEKMDRIKAVAHASWGLERGIVGILSPNCIEYIEYISALSEMGIGIATINYRLSSAEVAQISADSGAQIIFYDEECSHLLPSELPSHSLSDALPDAPPCPEIALDEEDVFAIPYTSGTTGLPKGVMISHRARAMTFYGMAAEYQCFSVDSYFLAIASLCHGAGFAFGFAPLFFGGTVELMAEIQSELSARWRVKKRTAFSWCPLTSDKSLTFHRIFSSDIEANTDSKPSSRMLQRCRSHSKSKSSISSVKDYSTRPMVQPRAASLPICDQRISSVKRIA